MNNNRSVDAGQDSPLVRIAFYGTPDFAVPGLEELINHKDLKVAVVITQPDRPGGRGKKIRFSPVKEVALKHGIPIIQPGSIRKTQADFLQGLEQYQPLDLGVVIAFGQILPLEILDFPKHGSVNVHASLLPRWRGAAPIQRAIMAGDEVTGVALMAMEEGLDTGPVYSELQTPIEKTDTFETLHNKLSILGARLLAKDIIPLCSGKVTASAQPQEGTTYARKVNNDEAQIDWSRTAQEISRQIKGLSPVPGAFTFLGEKRLKIFDASPRKPLVQEAKDLKPGAISMIDRKALEIQCGHDVLSLEDVQLEGKKRLEIGQFLRGSSLDDTVVLG